MNEFAPVCKFTYMQNNLHMCKFGHENGVSYMYNIGVGLDASLLLCLNNGFADLVYFGNNLNYR